MFQNLPLAAGTTVPKMTDIVLLHTPVREKKNEELLCPSHALVMHFHPKTDSLPLGVIFWGVF